MSSSAAKPLVLVIGGTGNVGVTVLQTLAQVGSWRLAASVRPSSISKPQVTTLRNLGVEIRPSDWQNDTSERLDELFCGAEIVISLVSAVAAPDQTILVDAAKRAGVKRFIPCDFGTACVPGVRDMYDEKLDVQRYVKASGVPYTFIDVGIWYQLSVPYRGVIKGWVPELVREFYGDGEKKSAMVSKDNIGTFVARIIADPRTLNQYVFIYDDERTLNDVYEISSRIAGEDFHKIKVVVSEEEVVKRATEARAEYKKNPGAASHAMWSWYQYMHSIHFRGDNTVAVAKSQGALDGKELYPDIKYQSVAEYAEEFYSGPAEDPGYT